MAHLTNRAWPIELCAQLLDQFTFRPSQALIVNADSQHALFVPTVPFDLIGITAVSAIASGCKPHATPPWVSMAQWRIAMASASLSSAGEKPRARAAAIMACFGALPLPVVWRLMVPTGTPA